jgi:hypothetical protein
MPIKAYNFTNCRIVEIFLDLLFHLLFINVNNALERDGNVIIFKQFKYLYSQFALDVFNSKQFLRPEIIEKFNDESPKSVKRINGLGCLKRYFDYPLVLIFAYLLNIGRIVSANCYFKSRCKIIMSPVD